MTKVPESAGPAEDDGGPGEADWVTMFEVLEVTGLRYAEFLELVERGTIRSRRSGRTELYAAGDVLGLVTAPVPNDP